MTLNAPSQSRQTIIDEDIETILSDTAELWKDWQNARLFITGGTGFLGAWLLRAVFAANKRFGLDVSVSALSRNPARFLEAFPEFAAEKKLRMIRGDAAAFRPPPETFDYIVHAATDADAETNRLHPERVLFANIEGTKKTLELAGRDKTRGYLFTSSCAVYGPATVNPIPETCLSGPDPTRPTSTYAEAKRVGELLCGLAAAKSIPARIARIFSVVGPGLPLDRHFAVGHFIRDALAGGPITITGDGTSIRSYMYVAEQIAWLLHILCRGAPGLAYNAGINRGASLLTVAETIADLAGLPRSAIDVKGGGNYAHSVSTLVPDTARAEEKLGLRARVDLSAALARTLAFCRCEDSKRPN